MSADSYYNWSECVDFYTYLDASGLAPRSIKEYMNYHLKFYDKFGEENPTQKGLNQFVTQYNNQPARTFVRHILDFRKLKELEIPKKKGSTPKKQKNYITPEEIEMIAIRLHKKNPKYSLMLLLSYECALRRKELLSVHVEDFEWPDWYADKSKSGILKITHRGAKRKKERFVVVPAPIMEAIYDYAKSMKLLKSDPLWGISWKSSLWHTKFKEVVRAMDRNYSLHELRYSKATYWHREDVNIMRIKDRLGHSSVSTTQLYIDPSSRDESFRWKEDIDN